MKKIANLHILAVGIFLSSITYAQTTTSPVNIKELKVPTTRNTYELSVENAEPPYQVRINDIPIVTSSVKGPTTFFINTTILKSGPQTIKTVMDGKADDTKITIKAIRRRVEGVSQKDTIVWTGSGAGSFYARVPYEIGDIEGCQDLNNPAMIAAGQKYFTDMLKLLKEHNGEAFMQIIKPALQNGATANYLQRDEINKHYLSWTKFINKGGYFFADKDGKIEVVGGGKLLHLVHQNMEGGLLLKTPKGQDVYIDLYLAIPNGKKVPQPVLINFKQVRKDFR